MAKIVSTYNTDGSSQEEFLPEPSDFVFIYMPKSIPNREGPPPESYTAMREKLKKSELAASVPEVVEWMNEEIENLSLPHFAGADHWLAEKTDWWGKIPEDYRKDFLSSLIPSYRMRASANSDIWEDIFVFPRVAIIEALVEFGPVMTFAVPSNTILEPVYPGDKNAESANRNSTTEAAGKNDTCATAACAGDGGCNSNPAEVCCASREGSDGPCHKEGGGPCPG